MVQELLVFITVVFSWFLIVISANSTMPGDRIVAAVGTPVLLNCSIPHQLPPLGQDVIWLRQGRYVLMPESDGKVLGSEGRIIILPYNEHHIASLRINDARVDDEGRFECILPNGKRSSAIHLKIIESPSLPELAAPNTQLIANPGKRTSFTCSASGGHPKPNFLWYILSGNDDAENWEIASTEWTTVESNETFTTSVLTVDGSALFPKMQIKCVASHPAYSDGNASVVIKPQVVVPPSSLTLYPRPKAPVAAHTTFKTTCSIVAPEHNSSPVSLIWIRNGKLFNNSKTVGQRRLGNLIVSDLKLTIGPVDNFAVFRCEARSSALETPLFEQFQLIVHFEPMPVKNDFMISSNKKWVSAGSNQVKFRCSTLANPGAKITWAKDNTPITGLPMTHTETPTDNGLGIITTSEIEMKLEPENTVVNMSTFEVPGIIHVNISCQATNFVGTRTANFPMKIVLPPKRLQFIDGKSNISVNENSHHLRIMAGQVLQLSCAIDRTDWLPPTDENSQGVPLLWADSLVRSIKYKWLQVDDGILLSEHPTLSLHVSRVWNGRKLQCLATSQLVFPRDTPVEKHSLLYGFRLDVLYAPERPSIKLGSNIKLPAKEGSQISASCLPSSGNPLPSARWIVDSLHPPLLGSNFRIERAIGGGSTIHLTASAYLDGAAIACESFNQLGRNVSKLVLSTLYRPIFTDCPSDVTIALLDRPNHNGAIMPETSKLPCKVKAKPTFVVDDVFLTIDNEDVTHTVFIDEKTASLFVNDGFLNLPRSLLEAKLPVTSSTDFPVSSWKSRAFDGQINNGDEKTLLFDDIGTIPLTVTIANRIGKASRTVFIHFDRSGGTHTSVPMESINTDHNDNSVMSLTPSSPASSAAVSVLIACLTAVGVMLIAANILFVSLYIARRTIFKRALTPLTNRSPKRSGGSFQSTSRTACTMAVARTGKHDHFELLLSSDNADAQQSVVNDGSGQTDFFHPAVFTASLEEDTPVSGKKLVTLEDVAGLVLKRNTPRHETTMALAPLRGQQLYMNADQLSCKDNAQTICDSKTRVRDHKLFIEQDQICIGSRSTVEEDNILCDDNDSGHGDSNRGVILLEAMCSCSPASNSDEHSRPALAGSVPDEDSTLLPVGISITQKKTAFLPPLSAASVTRSQHATQWQESGDDYSVTVMSSRNIKENDQSIGVNTIGLIAHPFTQQTTTFNRVTSCSRSTGDDVKTLKSTLQQSTHSPILNSSDTTSYSSGQSEQAPLPARVSLQFIDI